MNISSRPMVVLFNFCRKITNNFLILFVFFFNNTDLVKNILTDKLKRTESDHLEDLVRFVSGEIVEAGDLSIANTCESDKNATLYTYHIRYHIKDDKGNRYYIRIEYTKESRMNKDAGVTYISVSLLDDDDTDLSIVSIGDAT